jgi:hypothetical protein
MEYDLFVFESFPLSSLSLLPAAISRSFYLMMAIPWALLSTVTISYEHQKEKRKIISGFLLFL